MEHLLQIATVSSIWWFLRCWSSWDAETKTKLDSVTGHCRIENSQWNNLKNNMAMVQNYKPYYSVLLSPTSMFWCCFKLCFGIGSWTQNMIKLQLQGRNQKILIWNFATKYGTFKTLDPSLKGSMAQSMAHHYSSWNVWMQLKALFWWHLMVLMSSQQNPCHEQYVLFQ